MTISKFIRILSISLVLLMVFLTGCTGNGKNSGDELNVAPWAVTKYNTDEIVDENGEYIVDKLTPAQVVELKTVGDKQVIYHLGKPYLFHAMHLRIDHLQSARDDAYATNKITDSELKAIFDDGMRRIKEAGYDTVILYFSWSRFFDGEKYDFSELEYQYSVAKKYDMKIMWNWYGYDVCGYGGYREWQNKDWDKYPPLKDSDGNVVYSTAVWPEGSQWKGEFKAIPDLSVQSFIDIEVEAINQFCAWLNVNDEERRTIGIQLENEPNHTEGGHGLWFSQYDALAHLLDELGRAVKEGPYSMLTYLNLMSAGWDQVDENGEKTVFNKQVLGLIEKEYIDIVGYDFYDSTVSDEALSMSAIEQGDNPYLMVEFGSCVWAVPAQTNILLSKGYGIGYYHAVNYKYTNKDYVDSGFFSFDSKSNPYILRDGSHIISGGYHNGDLEVVASEFIIMNQSIKALSELIAVSANEDMIYFNNKMINDLTESKTLGGKTFTFDTEFANERYGATALLIRADDTTYYTYAHKTATITLDGGIKSASEGVYKDGKWVKIKDVEIVNGMMTYEAGKAYQFIIG